MGYGSIVSIFDRLSTKTVLTNSTGSYLGFVGTLALIIVSLIILIPPVNQYFKGAYFESQFVSQLFPKNIYVTGDDLILATAFRNKQTGEYANHTEIYQKIYSNALYSGHDKTYKVDLQPCKPEVFLDAINPLQVKDCLMIPFGLEYDIMPVQGNLPTIELTFKMKCQDMFKCADSSPFKAEMQKYIMDLTDNYYYEYILNSKVLDDKGQLRNQFHKIYSTEYASPDGLGTLLRVEGSQKKYFIDDSILPWWNNRTYENLYWTGKAMGRDIQAGAVAALGFYSKYFVYSNYHYSYRYYKKLDFILGIIGGAVSLLYLFFWTVLSCINRTLQKMKNAEQLLFEKDDIITTHENLHKIKIPFYYILTRFIPYSHRKQKAMLSAAESEIDIVRLIKKIKVTHRNLRTKGYNLTFKTRDIDLQSNEPEEFVADRPALENYEINLQSYQALCSAVNTKQIYQNNAPVLALTENNGQKIDVVMEDQVYNKQRKTKRNLKEKILHWVSSFFKFFDVFGARPMLNAEPENSSFWGFFLTLVIITISVLTFALTIQNMDSVKIITSYKFQDPLEHNYQIQTGKNFRLAFCVVEQAMPYLIGASKTVQLTFFKQSKRNGYEELAMDRMNDGEFQYYFELTAENPYSSVPAQYCFKPQDGQKAQMGGSYETINEAYIGVRIDPYCSGTPSECALRKTKTITDYIEFAKMNSYGFFISENTFSPQLQRITSGIVGDEISQTNTLINASLLRTQTVYLQAVELLDDTSKAFFREKPRTLQKTAAFSQYGQRNQQRKGDPNADPGFVLEFRPNGQLKQIILRSYKIDFLLGLIGGIFAFWYFFIHFFAKIYNTFKVRAKLAQILHRQDGYDESIFVKFLYITKLSYLCCCSKLRQDIQRVSKVDNKMYRQLDYLQMSKKIDNCYRLSSCMFPTLVEKDLSMIYFRQKIDESQLVKPKRISIVENEEFEDDQFLQLDNDDGKLQQSEQGSVVNISNTFLPENSRAQHQIDIDKVFNMNKSKDDVPLYQPEIPNIKQRLISRIIKQMDVFKTPAELTLDGQRDVKSIIGGLMFFVVVILSAIVCAQFLTIYLDGQDYTVSHRRLIDGDLDKVDSSNTLGELNPGINFMSGKNFKFAVAFNKKDNNFPHDVSQYIGPIGIRMLQYTIVKENGNISETYKQTQLQPCNQNYLDGFLSPYNDREAFANLTLGYCLPDGKPFSLSGTPSDNRRTYFKLNVYNKYGNSTGRSFLNSFFKVYIATFYVSIPKLDLNAKDFKYEMMKYNPLVDNVDAGVENNLTFSKTIFTDKYYSRSKQTYNDRSPKYLERTDIDEVSNETTRNLTFYYDGNLDHYVLDYPGGGQLFGLVGGVIVFFTFICYSIVNSFNQYRMKYLIGQRLYTFDKKLSGLSKQKGKKINTKKIEAALSKINNFNQLQIFLAWILNPIGYIRDNYNFNKTLRRVTLLIDKVQSDINLYNVYKSLLTFDSLLNKNVKLKSVEGEQLPVNLTNVHIKHIFNPDPISNSIPIIAKQSRKHKLSPFEEVKINKAIQAKIDPQLVLGDKVLNRAFGIDDGSSILDDRLKMSEQVSSNMMQLEQIKNKKKPKSTKKIKVGENSEAKLNQNSQLKESQGNLEAFSIDESRDG